MLVLRGGSAGNTCFCQFLLMVPALGFDADSADISAGETGSAADAGVCWYCWFCWFRPALPMLLVVSGPGGGAGYDGLCW